MDAGTSSARRSLSPVGWPLAGLIATVTGWFVLTRTAIPFVGTFPFMSLAAVEGPGGALIVSLLVSVIYVGATELVYRSFWPLAAPRAVRFIARNTLIIFLVHMPLYTAVLPVMLRWSIGPVARSAILFVLCLPGLAVLSEGIRWVVRPRQLRERIYARLPGYAA